MKTRLYPGVLVMRDGREVCRPSEAGRREYRRRVELVWQLYCHTCVLCLRPVTQEALTGDHREPRGMGGGFRDDRLRNLLPAHGGCNAMKGSRHQPELLGRSLRLLRKALDVPGYLAPTEMAVGEKLFEELRKELRAA